VKSGDNLSKIAMKYKTSVRALKAANNKTSDLIRVGEKLMVPVAGASSGSSTVTSPAPTAAVKPARAISAEGTHIVKAGEYPATIARQYGMTASELLALNGITDPRKMQIGQKLKVSSTGSVANVVAKTATVVAAEPAVAASSDGPIEIRVIEADPLVEEEILEINTDALFENAVEIPVIRLED
jgi:LysM repeat protein